MKNDKQIIVGLGNPGNLYKNTRHNVGFNVIDLLIEKFKFPSFQLENGIIFNGQISETNVYFAKPLTFMNLSGIFVQNLLKYQNVTVDKLVIVYDDLALPLGTFKLKSKGSCAGHNGVKSIIKCLGTENIQRIKVGIQNSSYNPNKKNEYVLGTFSVAEQNELASVYVKVIKVIEKILKFGFDYSLNWYNQSGNID